MLFQRLLGRVSGPIVHHRNPQVKYCRWDRKGRHIDGERINPITFHVMDQFVANIEGDGVRIDSSMHHATACVVCGDFVSRSACFVNSLQPSPSLQASLSDDGRLPSPGKEGFDGVFECPVIVESE